MATRAETKQSLVDIAEEALRSWLATGRHRPGERLPPEQELSARSWESPAAPCAPRSSAWRTRAR